MYRCEETKDSFTLPEKKETPMQKPKIEMMRTELKGQSYFWLEHCRLHVAAWKHNWACGLKAWVTIPKRIGWLFLVLEPGTGTGQMADSTTAVFFALTRSSFLWMCMILWNAESALVTHSQWTTCLKGAVVSRPLWKKAIQEGPRAKTAPPVRTAEKRPKGWGVYRVTRGDACQNSIACEKMTKRQTSETAKICRPGGTTSKLRKCDLPGSPCGWCACCWARWCWVHLPGSPSDPRETPRCPDWTRRNSPYSGRASV